MQVFLFFLLHILLAFMFQWSSIFSTTHAILTIIIGFFWVTRDPKPSRPIALIGYITGAELLWRGTGANVFWEYGKYASVFLLFFMLMRYAGQKRADQRAIVYFVLLLPSIVLMPSLNREALSSNLSGPLALALAILFFSQLKISRQEFTNFLLAMLAPILGLAAIVGSSTLLVESVDFLTGYGGATSAEIGPNQVSSILGLGALVAFILVILFWERAVFRWGMIGIILVLLSQTALTFSRGGFWTAVAAIVVVGYFLLRDSTYRIAFVFIVLFGTLVSYFLIFPALDRFTGQSISGRFSSFEMTGRDKLIEADLIAFRQNPLFGVGPGESRYYHDITFRESQTHTEYSRLLAEHGFLGLLALLILVVISLQRYFRRSPDLSKAIILGFTAWAVLYMFHSATRLAAPSILFGIASASLVLNPDVEKSPAS